MVRHALIVTLIAAGLAVSPGVRAADLISYPISTDRQVPISSIKPAYDWNGFYAGIYGSYRHGAASGDQAGLGIDAGVNATFNFVLVGAEVALEGLNGGSGGTSYVSGIGRAGVLVSNNTLLYGAAGYGIDTGPAAESDALVGGGLEYAITDSMTVRGQYLHGFPVTGANPKDEITLGAQFHF